MSDKTQINVIIERVADSTRHNISLAYPIEQDKLTVKQSAHLLIGGVCLLIKSCSKLNTGIKDYELIKEVIEHLNHEFSSIASFEDAYVNKKGIKLEDDDNSK